MNRFKTEKFGAPSNLQPRSNCYGYAFRYYSNSGSPLPYKQQPGEFASKSNGIIISYQLNGVIHQTNIRNYDDLDALYRLMYWPGSALTNQARMAIMTQLMAHDGQAVGYTVTPYTGSVDQYRATHPNSRLIALVVNYSNLYDLGDYHYYMQHDNGTWSHKPGEDTVYNICRNCETELTDSNIANHMAEGIYAGGQCSFFEITKSAVIDYPHYNGKTSVQTYLPPNDRAGNQPIAAQVLGTAPCTYTVGSINYLGDYDYYAITTQAHAARKNYVFSVTPVSADASLSLMLLNAQGTIVNLSVVSSANGSRTIVNSCDGNTTYILCVYVNGQLTYDYGRSYTVTVTQQT